MSSKKKTSRRGFLKGIAIGAAASTRMDLFKQQDVAEANSDGHYPAQQSQVQEFDFTEQSGALQSDRIVIALVSSVIAFAA
jgi:formate dehydrogenase (coenzyme F420) alpha subunit